MWDTPDLSYGFICDGSKNLLVDDPWYFPHPRLAGCARSRPHDTPVAFPWLQGSDDSSFSRVLPTLGFSVHPPKGKDTAPVSSVKTANFY